MKVLVTGGAGFIGSHIVDQCIERGFEVAVVDNLSAGKKEQVHPDISFYSIDICGDQLRRVFDQEQPDVVIHQAAQVHVGTSVTNPVKDAQINVMGTLNVLEASRQFGVKKVVYASTAAVYGEPNQLPMDEKHAIDPISPYGLSKYTAERYLEMYHRLYGLSYTILRYANVYGPRQDPRGEGGVISIFIDQVLLQQRLTVFGDGGQTRDYIFVADVAAANVAAIDAGDGEVFNIGTGKATSLNDLIGILDTLSGRKNPVNYGEERVADIRHSAFDPQKAMSMLSWQPRFTLQQGLEETYTYYVEQRDKQGS